MMADYLIGIGTILAGIGASISAIATILGNRRVKQVQAHLVRQDRALGINQEAEE